jgi:hypothetical protein
MLSIIVMMMMITASLQGSGVVLVEGLSAANTKSTNNIIYTSTDIPPLVDVPVWSMATLNENDDDDNKTNNSMNNRNRTTNMNIITYVTPISIRPNRLYALGLYKKTLSRDNFLREKTCILQILSDGSDSDSTDNEEEEHASHISCVKLLGGQSGYDISKQLQLEGKDGIELQDLITSSITKENEDVGVELLPKVLPGCVQYLKLSLVGDGNIIEYDDGESSHDIVICKVDEMWTSSSSEQQNKPKPQKYLSTGKLRELGIITEQGRIA